MHDKLLELDHYVVNVDKDGYRVINKKTKKVEYKHEMLPTVIATAEALNTSLEKILNEYEVSL